jgi:hypothetical protein
VSDSYRNLTGLRKRRKAAFALRLFYYLLPFAADQPSLQDLSGLQRYLNNSFAFYVISCYPSSSTKPTKQLCMRKIIWVLALVLPGIAFSQTTRREITGLKTRRTPDDTSYVYWLPYKHHKKFLLVQAALSSFSHKTDIALDFKMKVGSSICAARGGVVESMHEASDRGGAGNDFINDGNYIIIRHSDGSKAMYWHLKKDGVLVNEGDTVQQGQEIGLSGNTGYSAFPHLHFEVQGYNDKGEYTQIPVRFMTKKGARYLRPLRSYKALHKS